MDIYYGWVSVDGGGLRYILGGWGEWKLFMVRWRYMDVYLGVVGMAGRSLQVDEGWVRVG